MKIYKDGGKTEAEDHEQSPNCTVDHKRNSEEEPSFLALEEVDETSSGMMEKKGERLPEFGVFR